MKRNIYDYKKEQARGTLKQIMKVRGLRTISIANYFKWLNENGGHLENPLVHSLKLDIQDGYINAYGWAGNKCGSKIEDLSALEYSKVLNIVNSIITDEPRIPYTVKRNIFVKVAR